MLVVDQQIVERIDLADDLVVHGNDAAFQGTTELHVRLAVTKQQHIGCVAADVD